MFYIQVYKPKLIPIFFQLLGQSLALGLALSLKLQLRSFLGLEVLEKLWACRKAWQRRILSLWSSLGLVECQMFFPQKEFEAVVFHPTRNDEQFPTFKVINILRSHKSVTCKNFYLSEIFLLNLKLGGKYLFGYSRSTSF